ncbi:hypothetical protein F2Q68_00022749 [Brassica cretica]|uniref:Uncharacterized protein n=2 Tax=Brassica cretica TaxID=69181 RepID=A0A3N6TRV1_BRACR|nr:hypothetical protein F2Q68_00022749 [Brassica cretica]KAF3563958.1 hypothetical protein DY000_02018970 [Brassica cretica]
MIESSKLYIGGWLKVWESGRPVDESHLPWEEDMSRRLSESCFWWCAAAALDLYFPFIAVQP